MEAWDKMKSAIQSGKEKAIIDSVMTMFGSHIQAIQPENTVAAFIAENAPGLFMPSKEHEGEFDAMAGIVAKLLVAEANDDPAHAFQKLKAFVLAFQEWYIQHVKLKDVRMDTEMQCE